MSRSSTFVWRAARQSIGLPELPSFLDEPQYANLWFDKHCHVSMIHVPSIQLVHNPKRPLPRLVLPYAEREDHIMGISCQILP
jgi:hypothetical protein